MGEEEGVRRAVVGSVPSLVLGCCELHVSTFL